MILLIENLLINHSLPLKLIVNLQISIAKLFIPIFIIKLSNEYFDFSFLIHYIDFQVSNIRKY